MPEHVYSKLASCFMDQIKWGTRVRTLQDFLVGQITAGLEGLLIVWGSFQRNAVYLNLQGSALVLAQDFSVSSLGRKEQLVRLSSLFEHRICSVLGEGVVLTVMATFIFMKLKCSSNVLGVSIHMDSV